MKRFLSLLLIGSFSQVNAQKTLLESYNAKVTLPFGWTISLKDGIYVCSSSDQSSFILIIEDGDHSIQYYNTALLSGVDIGSGFTVKTSSNLITLTSKTAYSPVLIYSANGNYKGWAGFKERKQGGLIGFLSLASSQNLEDNKKKMLAMLYSCEELAGQSNRNSKWVDILTYNRLEGNFSSYSSGYGGDGYASGAYYDFCTNGTYKYTYEFSSSLGGTKNDVEYGTWNIVEKGSTILKLTSTSGQSAEYSISQKEGVIYIGKGKFMKNGYSPNCR